MTETTAETARGQQPEKIKQASGETEQPTQKTNQEAGQKNSEPAGPKETIMAIIKPDEEGKKALITDPNLVKAMRKIATIAPPGAHPEYWQKALEILLDLDNIPEEELGLAAGAIHAALETSEETERVRNKTTMTEAMQEDIATYDVFVNAEFIQEPIGLQIDTFPPRWFKEMSPEQQQAIRTRIRISKAVAEKRRYCDFDPEKTLRNEHLSLTQREFMLLYKMPGVRWALENYMKSLFTLDKEGKLELKKYDGKTEQVKKSLGAFQSVQERIIKHIVERKIDGIGNETDARAAVAVAWNFLFIGNVVESADTHRDIDPVGGVLGEAVRTTMHPMAKAIAKYGVEGRMQEIEKIRLKTDAQKDEIAQKAQREAQNKSNTEEELKVGTEEGWGKGIGIWISARIGKDKNIAQALWSGNIRPFPTTIFASFPELITVDTKRGTMSMARALMKGEEITHQKTDSDLFGDYTNTWDSAFKVYQHAMGEVPLDMKQTTPEIWGSALADAMGKLRRNPLLRNACDKEAIFWIIVNSLGGPKIHSSAILLNLDGITYDTIINRIVNVPRLVADEKDRSWIKQKLNAEGPLSFITRTLLAIKAAKEVSRR